MDMQVEKQLSQEAVDEFKRIYQLEFGEALTDDAAQEMALRLLRVFDLLTRRVPAEPKETPPVIHC
jgi:hypothetical protein